MVALREKCPRTKLFLVHIQIKYTKIRTRDYSVFGYFSRSSALSDPGELLKNTAHISSQS